MSALVIEVRLHDGRYHGKGDWPPSPARLFQALVAGAGLSGPIEEVDRAALTWLERQGAPVIGAPPACQPRRGVLFYMPNNDSDSIGGDEAKVAQIRTATKIFRPYLFNPAVPLVYAWSVGHADEDKKKAAVICALAERLYQLGLGIDMAWASGTVLEDSKIDEWIVAYQGQVLRPDGGNGGVVLACPAEGSLESIEHRYQAQRVRFRYAKTGRSVKGVLRQPSRPRFQTVAYNSPSSWQLYELREPTAEAKLAAWPLNRVYSLITRLRDGAAQHLRDAVPSQRDGIERALIGRKPDGTNHSAPAGRVRILPLPSIGHIHADSGIRRVLVGVPSDCLLRADDVHWAFSGLEVLNLEADRVVAVLTRAEAPGVLRLYGLENDGGQHRVWRTVTPAALPEGTRRRRIDPLHKGDEAKAGGERVMEQARATAAVCQALRHAGVRTGLTAVRVQREPFERNGARVEAFADNTRFDSHRLWHVEITFASPCAGPLSIGDGRFLGLGVMVPAPQAVGVHTFLIESGIADTPDPMELVRAFRRAVMARVQAVLGDNVLAPFFTGHETNGAPARSETNPHLFFLFMPEPSRLLVIAPHIVEKRGPKKAERKQLQELDEALCGLHELRAGAEGYLRLRPIPLDTDADPVFTVSRVWDSVTPYVVTRHRKHGDAAQAFTADLRAECQARGFPMPKVEPREMRGVSGVGLIGGARLTFQVPVNGPLLLGKHRHRGGGVFVGEPHPGETQ